MAQAEAGKPQFAHLELLTKRRRKKKKRRKRRLPRTSSHSTRGRARRRHRPWHVPGWYSGFGASRAVFPSFVGRPELPGIVVGMEEKDSYADMVDSRLALQCRFTEHRCCLRVQRNSWFDSGFLGHYFYGPLYLAVTCLCWSCLKSTSTPFFWELTSGNAVLSASWFDSGYMLFPVYGGLYEFPTFSTWVYSDPAIVSRPALRGVLSLVVESMV